MAKISESQSESGQVDLQESNSGSDQRISTAEESGSGSKSHAGPIVVDACVKKSNDDSKKLLFQRIWSEDDEIAILNGFTEFSIKKKSNPMANLTAFHDFIKNNLQVDVSRTQLQHKIRRLKNKYQNNKNKAKNGKDRTFYKSHEQKAYDLSKTVWGNELGSNGSAVSKMGAKEEDRGALIVYEKEWKKLRMEEVELHCKQLELKLAQSRLVLDVLKFNDS